MPPPDPRPAARVSRRGAIAIAVAVIATLTVPFVFVRDAEAAAPPIVRLSGDDRIETALAISGEVFDAADTVVLARADSYPDALAGGPLAAALDAPILLTGRDGLDARVAAEVSRLGAQTAYLLGGTGALGEAVAQQVVAQTSVTSVVRLAGDDRFETAARIADVLDDLVPGSPTGVFVTEGIDADPTRGWPDALAAGPWAAGAGEPILLTDTDVLPGPTRDAIVASGSAQATIVGGTSSVGQAVESAVAGALAGEGRVVRVAGESRWATAAAAASQSTPDGTFDVWIATGRDFPDALAAGPAVAITGGVLLLIDGRAASLDPAVEAWLEDRSGHVDRVVVVGGTGVVSDQVAALVADALDAEASEQPSPERSGEPTPSPTPTASETDEPSSSDCTEVATFPVDEVNAYEQSDGYPDPELAVTCADGMVTVTSNNIPTFEFVQITPNDLQANDLEVAFPTTPTERDVPGKMTFGPVGISVTGLALFGAFESAQDNYGDPVSDGLLDFCSGHTAQDGFYHGHARMDCLFDEPIQAGLVYGWLYDGYPIVSPWECADDACTSLEEVTSSYVRVDQNSTGAFDAWEYREGVGDLDECNGRTDADGQYRYYATDDFPYLPFCFHGETDAAIGDFDGEPPAAGQGGDTGGGEAGGQGGPGGGPGGGGPGGGGPGSGGPGGGPGGGR